MLKTIKYNQTETVLISELKAGMVVPEGIVIAVEAYHFTTAAGVFGVNPRQRIAVIAKVDDSIKEETAEAYQRERIN